jgi:hypothetical protein
VRLHVLDFDIALVERRMVAAPLRKNMIKTTNLQLFTVSVLQKVGMKFIAAVDDPEEGKIWRWQISRDEYHS